MPDADAVADFTVGGKKLQFSGIGYHDKVRQFYSLLFLTELELTFNRTGVIEHSQQELQAGTGATDDWGRTPLSGLMYLPRTARNMLAVTLLKMARS